MRFGVGFWPPIVAVCVGLLAMPALGLATPDQQAPPPPMSVDESQQKPLPPPTPTSDLPPYGRVEAPPMTAANPRGHSNWSGAAGGTNMPLTVDEMKAHGYLGIPGSQDVSPGPTATPVGPPAATTAESDQAIEDASLWPDGADLGPTEPENSTIP